MAKPAPDLGRFDTDPDRSFNMPAAYYSDPEIFEREKQAIFFRSWRFVGHVTEIVRPGD